MNGPRLADSGDAPAIGRLLDAFNREYDDPTPGPAWLADRVVTLIEAGDTYVVLTGAGPDGLVVIRERPALWADAPEWYLAEAYVVPARRGRGLGRAMMEHVVGLARGRGVAWLDLATTEDDQAARGLYESLGFTRFEGGDGALSFYYELELD